MRLATRLLVCAALAAVVAVAVRRGPAGTKPRGPPPQTGQTVLVAVPEEGLLYLNERYERKLVIARDLADGRATLAEAASRLRELDRQMPPLVSEPHLAHPWLPRSVTGDEVFCRDILHAAHVEFDDNPEARSRLDDWDCELEAWLANGPVVLPG
jgi:hypothetical protein